MPPKIPKSSQTTVYLGNPRQVAEHFSLGQGFKALSFDAERRLVNREWVGRSEYIHAIHPSTYSAVCSGPGRDSANVHPFEQGEGYHQAAPHTGDKG